MRTMIIPLMCLLTISSSCKNNNPQVLYTSEPAVIYKTKADYSQLVPITLSADKSSIVAYPAPKDVYYKGVLAKPKALKDGFWLDNRGIGPNSAFLKLTYEEYSKLNSAPLLSDMMNMLTDKDPFTEIYNLGNRDRFKDEVKEINALITKGALKKFKKIK